MNELKYDDFLRRINIQDVLKDAGYQLNRKDGIRYPSYVRLDSNGKRIKGDKFIVTANGMCCFQPPAQKNYNVIGFIKEHPTLFPDYTPSMSVDKLVNVVCNRLLNNPIEYNQPRKEQKDYTPKVFSIKDYECLDFNRYNFASQKPFYSFFKPRGINLDTQKAFGYNFMIAIKEASNGQTYTNLVFPLRKPSDLSTIVGLEERSRPAKEGRTSYKGMAAGSNATEGMWIASPSKTELSKVKDVYWFESAFDAMAFYQIQREQMNNAQQLGKKETDRLARACFISTGGNPSMHQFKGMLAQTQTANHHLCFDRDEAGRTFALNFLVAKNNADVKIMSQGDSTIIEANGEKHLINFADKDFKLEEVANKLHLNMGMVSDKLSAYMMSLRNDSIFSGDEWLLPKDLLDLYGKYESDAEEYYSSKQSGLVCQDDLSDIRKTLEESHKVYSDAMRAAVAEFRISQDKRIYYEPCNKSYKDWNDQLLDKKAYSQNDEIETDFDDNDNDVVIEREEEYEEKDKNEEAEERQEEKKRSWFHR